jgi:glycosyltransferase involved in cell wall biosynthesis
MTSGGRPRVLLLAHNSEGVGTYLRFEHLARQMARMEIPVTLIAGAWAGKSAVRSSEGGFTKILVPEPLGRRASNGGFGPYEILFRIRHILQHSVDIVHASEHRPASLWPAWIGRRFRDMRFVGDWADLWGRGGIAELRSPASRVVFGAMDSAMEKRACLSADGVTVISRTLRDRALDLGVQSKKLLLLPNGADVDGIRPIDKTEARLRLGLPPDGKYLVYAGQAPIDMDLIWDSFAIVDSQFPGTVYLLVLGRRWRLPSLPEATGRRILQAGFVQRGLYPAYLACGDIMLLPLRDSGVNRARWPGKFGDYMAAGRPVVANPTGELRHLLEGESVGLPAGETPADFAGAILSLLADPAECERRGNRGRQLAEDALSWELVARPLPDFYQTLFSKDDRKPGVQGANRGIPQLD